MAAVGTCRPALTVAPRRGNNRGRRRGRSRRGWLLPSCLLARGLQPPAFIDLGAGDRAGALPSREVPADPCRVSVRQRCLPRNFSKSRPTRRRACARMCVPRSPDSTLAVIPRVAEFGRWGPARACVEDGGGRGGSVRVHVWVPAVGHGSWSPLPPVPMRILGRQVNPASGLGPAPAPWSGLRGDTVVIGAPRNFFKVPDTGERVRDAVDGPGGPARPAPLCRRHAHLLASGVDQMAPSLSLGPPPPPFSGGDGIPWGLRWP